MSLTGATRASPRIHVADCRVRAASRQLKWIVSSGSRTPFCALMSLMTNLGDGRKRNSELRIETGTPSTVAICFSSPGRDVASRTGTLTVIAPQIRPPSVARPRSQRSGLARSDR